MNNTKKINIVKQFYPDAKTIEETGSFVKKVIETRFGLDVSELKCFESASNNILSLSGIAANAAISVGGLGGFPFQGLSALLSVPHEIATQAGILILYCSDVDLQGEIMQDSQGSNLPYRNSATSLALNKLLNNQILLDHLSDLDYQMNFIEQVLLREQRRIRSSDYPLFEAAEVMYEAIDKRMQLLFSKTHFQCKYAVLAGGIHFKNPDSNKSYFVFKRFDCVDPKTKVKIDWTKIRLGNEPMIP